MTKEEMMYKMTFAKEALVHVDLFLLNY